MPPAMPRENLISLFAEFSRYRRDVAIVQRRGYRREAWRYSQLAGRSIACALELKERGVRTGHKVLIWGSNSIEWIIAFWGCLLRGAIAVPLDEGATEQFAARVVADAQVKFILAARGKPALSAAIPSLVLEDLPDTVKHPHLHGTMTRPGEPEKPLHETLADEPITRNHIAQILFTSGTTSEPRGVVLTHGNFLANLEPLERGIAPFRKYERWFHPLRFVSLVPLSHVFGQFMALFVPPLLGAAVVFEPSANPAEIIQTVKRERATALIAVPRALDILHGYFLRESREAASGGFSRKFAKTSRKKFLRRAWAFRAIHRRFGWKFWAFLSGGAALAPAVETFFKRLGFAVVQGYGMTETASLISLNHPFHATEGSVGKVLPGREFRLSEDGEILVRGENVSSGYWEKGELHSAEDGGWLRTGDLGEIDLEGNLRFLGRKKNVIVTPAGLNVYAKDLEGELGQENLRGCVVIPIRRGSDTEACAVVLPVREAGDFSAPERMRQRCADAVQRANSRLAEYQKIRQWAIWPDPDFPRTATGKPRLATIAERLPNLLSENGAAGSSQSPVGELLAAISPERNSVSLESLSSLDRVELLSALEQRYKVEIDESAFSEAKNVQDVERLLQQPTAQRSDYAYPRWAQRAPVRWFRLAVYYALVWPATQILGHPKIVGRENLRGVRGPLLFVSNHITRRADIGLILAALPMRFRHRLATAMGGETLQTMRRPPRDWFFARRWAYWMGYWLVTALFNVFPLPQHSGFRKSFSFAGESVDRGYSLLIFPEGEVNNTQDGKMAAFQSGIGLLVQNLRLPVIPLRLDGVWQMKRERRRLAHLGEITVRIGAPVEFAPATPPEEIAQTLESRVLAL